MKKVIEGYVCLTELAEIDLVSESFRGDIYQIPDVWLTRGKKQDYDKADWPPKKVKVTVEWDE